MSEFYSTAKENRFVSQEVRTADGEQNLHNRGMYISFARPGNETKGTKDITVNFKAFITAYNETYNCDWAAEQVYGRVDPIPMWKSTTRKITLAFKIPCFSVGEGYENLGRLQTLIKSLYPSYSRLGEAQTITQSPLVRIQLMNLLSDYSADAGTVLAEAQQGWLASSNSYGALGFIGNLTVNHNLESPDAGVIEIGNASDQVAGVVPKVIDINLDFTALHEHPLGWQKIGNTWHFGKDPNTDTGGPDLWSTEQPEVGFPYGVNIDGMENPSAADLKKAQNAAAQKYTEEQKKRQAQTQAEANAKARYSGLFGNTLRKRDERKAQKAAHETGIAAAQGTMAQWDKEDKYEAEVSALASILGAQNQFIDLGDDPYYGLTDDEIMDF